MPTNKLWTMEQPPIYVASSWRTENPTPFATDEGWVDPVSGEVVVAIRQLATRADEANVVGITLIDLNGSEFETGQTMIFEVAFNEEVTVDTSGGTPTLAFEFDGSESRNATYARGSSTNTLEFEYEVQAGDTSEQVVLVSPIALNGGTIVDKVDGVNTDLTFDVDPIDVDVNPA